MRRYGWAAAFVLFILLAGSAFLCAQSSRNALAQTPPMGWNTWNKFGCKIDEHLVRDMADALVASGMKDAGYQFVNIDDCWQVARDSTGKIVADPDRFPSGIKALADYVHSKGLKFGIYTDAGRMTCENRPGSYGHEVQDAKTYAEWGIDYVKVDWCNTEGLDPEVQYAKIADALLATGRPIVFSICNWGVKAPWRWAGKFGNLWRTAGDMSDTYSRMAEIGFGQSGLEKVAGPGHWNDPDMLEIGNGGMNQEEYRTHMSLWALLSAPLIAGNDLRSMTPETKELLTNAEAIAVDQDSKGEQGHRVWQEGSLQIWAKPLADGSQAVGLFNGTEDAIDITLQFKDIGIRGQARVRDLWQHKDMGSVKDAFKVNVASHGVVLVKVAGL